MVKMDGDIVTIGSVETLISDVGDVIQIVALDDENNAIKDNSKINKQGEQGL